MNSCWEHFPSVSVACTVHDLHNFPEISALQLTISRVQVHTGKGFFLLLFSLTNVETSAVQTSCCLSCNNIKPSIQSIHKIIPSGAAAMPPVVNNRTQLESACLTLSHDPVSPQEAAHRWGNYTASEWSCTNGFCCSQ